MFFLCNVVTAIIRNNSDSSTESSACEMDEILVCHRSVHSGSVFISNRKNILF